MLSTLISRPAGKSKTESNDVSGVYGAGQLSKCCDCFQKPGVQPSPLPSGAQTDISTADSSWTTLDTSTFAGTGAAGSTEEIGIGIWAGDIYSSSGSNTLPSPMRFPIISKILHFTHNGSKLSSLLKMHSLTTF